MTDYAKTTDFTAKDALGADDAEKIILGSDMDAEFDAIVTAITSKYDSNDLASQVEAEGGTNNTTLMTPLRVQDWAAKNASMVEDIQALTDPGADTLLGWDDSASAAIGFTLGAGLSHAATELDVAEAVAGTGLTMTSSVLNVIGGDGITANANDVALTPASATTTNPVEVASGVISFDASALATVEGNALAATDTVVVDVGGTPKGVDIQDLGMRVLAGSTGTLSASDMNSIIEFTPSGVNDVLTLPKNTTEDLPVGVPIVLNVKHATLGLTVTAATDVTLVSPFHPAGGSAASDTVDAGGTALLYKTADDVWAISGDIST